MTKVSYTINGITTTDFTEAMALGWNSYCNKPNYTEFNESTRTEEDKQTHRDAVDRHILAMKLAEEA